jgi:hypothetical protein
MGCSVGRRLTVAAPALIVAAPLSGIALQFDERRSTYRQAAAGRDNPVEALSYGYDSIGPFLDSGNFRPLGRFVQSLSAGFVLEASEATGLPPHAVNGFLRLLAVGLLAMVATRIVAAITGSGRFGAAPIVAVYPMVLGMALIANGRGGPLVYYPVVLGGAAILVLAACAAVARDTDMSPRRVRLRELVAMGLLGAAAAMYHELVYVAPPLAAAYIAARALADGLSWRTAVRVAALARWAALSAGFLVVLVPARLEIAARCGRTACYAPSDLSLSGDIGGLVATRLISGSPIAGWSLVSDLTGAYGLEFTFVNLLANSFLAMLVAAVVAVTIAVAAQAFAGAGDGAAAGAAPPSEEAEATGAAARRVRVAGHGPTGVAVSAEGRRARANGQRLRASASLGLFGAATAGLPALLVSLSRWLQASRIDYGWRDTMLVQVGWSLVVAAALSVTLWAVLACGGRRLHRAAATAAAAALGVGLACTLLANARLAQIDRSTPESVVTSQIAAAAINFDSSSDGNAVRCALIDAYARWAPEDAWIAAPGLLEDLDRLMLDRHGQPFCDPTRPRADRDG